jgi:hypothetical protein
VLLVLWGHLVDYLLLGIQFFSLDPYLSSGGIFLSGHSLMDNRKISLLNVYGPCQDRKAFWDSVDATGILAHRDLIIAGDMNFTTSSEEVWGTIQRYKTLWRVFLNRSL